MWKPEQRLVADRSGLRYPSDLTDPEWAIVQPMIPPARHGGRKRSDLGTTTQDRARGCTSTATGTPGQGRSVRGSPISW
jgi:hypothetical protein